MNLEYIKCFLFFSLFFKDNARRHIKNVSLNKIHLLLTYNVANFFLAVHETLICYVNSGVFNLKDFRFFYSMLIFDSIYSKQLLKSKVELTCAGGELKVYAASYVCIYLFKE